MLEQAQHVMIYIEQWPMQPGPVAHNLNFGSLSPAGVLETLQLLSWNRNSYAIFKPKVHQILLWLVPGSHYTRVNGLELPGTCYRIIDLAAGNMKSV
jgi:hypothetical protein